ncbi:MAG: hypothetical protein K5981_01200 [Clostridia bacterium]|nr:hypothetical protein [Clostridia bacterium]
MDPICFNIVSALIGVVVALIQMKIMRIAGASYIKICLLAFVLLVNAVFVRWMIRAMSQSPNWYYYGIIIAPMPVFINLGYLFGWNLGSNK